VVAGSRTRREYPIAPGRIEGHGKRGKALTADYVLEYRNTKLGVVEAKALDEELTEGVAQAKNYAGKLAVRHTYATNGRGIYAIDMHTGAEGEIAAYQTPDELWAMTFAQPDAWRDRFAAVPFEDKGGSHPGRYYQDIAMERVMQAIAKSELRILLTLATGTGKTFIAFQIAWKLFHARWNLSGQPTRRPRILFLADRNLLANQAYNAFSAFPEDAMVRIKPEDIRKQGKVPKNGRSSAAAPGCLTARITSRSTTSSCPTTSPSESRNSTRPNSPRCSGSNTTTPLPTRSPTSVSPMKSANSSPVSRSACTSRLCSPRDEVRHCMLSGRLPSQVHREARR